MGGEYRKLNYFFERQGIIHRLACPHTHEQNGLVERRNRHILETGLALLAYFSVPLNYWQYALDRAIYLINCMPTKVLDHHSSPFQLLFNKIPQYLNLKVFGSLCFPFLRPYNCHKIQFRSSPCLFLGYSNSNYGYRCLDLYTNRLYVARHVRFNEHNSTICLFHSGEC